MIRENSNFMQNLKLPNSTSREFTPTLHFEEEEIMSILDADGSAQNFKLRRGI